MIRAVADGVQLSLIIQPKARRTEIVGPHNGALKIRLNAPPVDGQANEALTEFLAQHLGVAKGRVVLVKGASQRRKIVHVSGISEAQAREKLLAQGSSEF